MFELTILKKVDDNYYIVLCLDGETHCISKENLEIFIKNNKISNLKDYFN